MFSDEPFRDWILQTIRPLLVNDVMNASEFGEWSLTYSLDRMVDCQSEFCNFDHFEESRYQASMLFTSSVGTNKRVIH